ncbi:zincin-like metallopeptidase domain-containing protein [Kaistella palustris]|uniref:zincin-like metallopeptidase domain-containing protein n=1 Tax=Kaistella palustris TaxID=493376 RepID=UPI000400E76A|nr:zincin-like metallopeptidase domain-containing protein [Kaistella palustris]
MNATAPKTQSSKSKKNQISKKGEDKFISRIIENLDNVKAQDWELYTNYKFQAPRNLFSQNAYKGFNLLALYIDTLTNGFTSSLYATFNAISKAGGRLKKGSKGVVIEFFTFVYKDQETSKIYSLEQVKKMVPADLENLVKIPVVRNYVVFNSNQIENLEELNLSIAIDEPEELDFVERENCEKFIQQLTEKASLKIKYIKTAHGSYSPTLDQIKMPLKQYFISEEKFYTTLFHEIIHWTGHENRLNRNLFEGFNNKEKYSFEELIAEMGSMLLALQFGITDELLNSIRYLKGWSDVNKENRIENIKTAFIQSKRAKKYLEQF